MKKSLWWGIGVLLILALTSGGWWIWVRFQGPLMVKAREVAPISMQEEVFATGSLVPVFSQEVRVLNPGRVSKVAVKVGDFVQVGQILVALDTSLADAQVVQAKANIEVAQTNLNAAQAYLEELKKAQSASAASVNSLLPGYTGDQKDTLPINTVSPSVITQAEGALAQSKAVLKQAQETLKVAQVQQEQMIYKAAIAGTVLEINAQEGNLSPVQQPLVIVADIAQMNVEAQLNEVDAGKIQLGQKVTVTSKVLGNISAHGTIAKIAIEAVTQPSVQGKTLPTVGVRIHLDQVPVGLKPGSTVSMQIVVSTKEGVLAVPQEALFQEGKQSYVYLIQGGSLHKMEVQIGIGNDTHQEITSGVNAGDLVVLNPSNQLSEGLAVTPDMGSGST